MELMRPLKEIDIHLYYWLKSQSFVPDDELLKEGFEVVYAAKVSERVVDLAERIARYEKALKIIVGEVPCFDNLLGDKDIAALALK